MKPLCSFHLYREAETQVAGAEETVGPSDSCQQITSGNEKIEIRNMELDEKSKDCKRQQKQLEIKRYGIYQFTNDNMMINIYNLPHIF